MKSVYLNVRSRSLGRIRVRGFTLIEMAVVIFVMALILGSILVPLSTQVEQRQVIEAERQLEEIKEALIGYAISQTAAALPCPDKTAGTTSTGFGSVTNEVGDGVEDIAADGTCEAVTGEGNLPWVTLGLAATDPWGNRFRYRVSRPFSNRDPAATSALLRPFTLTTTGTLRGCGAIDTANSANCAAPDVRLTVNPPATNAPVAMVLSHGPNGWGAINAVTGALLLPPGCADVVGCASMSADERANGDDNDTFVTRPPTSANAAAGEFDDIVTWLSPHTLKHRVVAAGKLPVSP